MTATALLSAPRNIDGSRYTATRGSVDCGGARRSGTMVVGILVQTPSVLAFFCTSDGGTSPVSGDAHRWDMTHEPMSGASDHTYSHDVSGLGHYGVMTPRQLLLRGPERTNAELDLVENRTGAPSASFEDLVHGVRVPRFGGASLLKAAARALSLGYQVRKFELVGADRAAIRTVDTEREISDELVDALERSGPTGVQGLLRHDYRSYLVCGVEVYSSTTRVVTLRRNGVMVGADDEKLWVFIHAVLEDDVT